MIFAFLKNSADGLFTRLENFTSTKFWIIKAALALTLLSLFFTFPNYKVLKEPVSTNDTASIPSISQMVQRQVQNPLYIVPDCKGAQPEKRQFRILMPVIGHLLHLNVKGLIAIQQIVGILFFIVIILLVSGISGDNVMALLTAAAFAFSYMGKACFVDLWPFFDGIAYCLLALSMLYRKPLLIFLCVLAASFTDERALIASALIFLWWKMRSAASEDSINKSLFRPDWASSSVVIAWVAYFAIRVFLTKHYHFVTHHGSMAGVDAAYKQTWKYLTFALLSGPKMLWLVIFLGIAALLIKRQYLFCLLLLASIAISTGVSAAVYDVTKSISYIFPAIFIALWLLSKSDSRQNLRYLFLVIVILCFLIPSFSITGPIKYMMRPVFFQIVSPQ
jgi:hypothetical protein